MRKRILHVQDVTTREKDFACKNSTRNRGVKTATATVGLC